jgi:hypothetical protein
MEPVSQPSASRVRPSQVTAAAWMIMVGSVFVVLMVWDRIAGLHSLQSRQALQSMLDQPGIQGFGLDVSDLMRVVQVVSMLGAGCATAMVFLGYQALQGSRGARLGLTVLAVPLFLAGAVTGRFVSFGVAAAVVTLWLGPARAWFDGRDPAASGTGATRPGLPEPPVRTSGPAPAPDDWAPPPTSVYDARPTVGFGTAPTPTAVPAPAVPAGARPRTVMWACVLTWICSGFMALLLVVSMTFLAADSTLVLRRMHEQNPALARQGLSDHAILVVCFVFCALCVVWCLASVGFGVLVFRRVRWAWFALVLSASAVAALCLIGTVGSLMALAPLVAAGATLALLLRPESRRWLG